MTTNYVVWEDANGVTHTETVTSPLAVVLREEELEALGVRVIHG